MVVTADKALLWTDSRYFIQAAQQLDGTEIRLMKEGLPETPDIPTWLTHNLTQGSTVGVDGMLFSRTEADGLAATLGARGIKLKTDFDPIATRGPTVPRCHRTRSSYTTSGMQDRVLPTKLPLY